MYFITIKRMLEVCFSAHPNIQYRAKKMNIDGYILTNLCTHLSKLGSGKVYTR